MRASTVARNYAEALFALGEKSGQTERFGELMEGLAGAIGADRQIEQVMISPRVPKDTKAGIFRQALAGTAPDAFLRFLDAVVKRGRQVLLGLIARQYHDLVDQKFNRVHAGVTVARTPDAALQDIIRQRLSDALDKEVIPHFREDPAILGGVVVRVGDRVMDGSVRRKLVRLKKQMLG